MKELQLEKQSTCWFWSSEKVGFSWFSNSQFYCLDTPSLWTFTSYMLGCISMMKTYKALALPWEIKNKRTSIKSRRYTSSSVMFRLSVFIVHNLILRHISGSIDLCCAVLEEGTSRILETWGTWQEFQRSFLGDPRSFQSEECMVFYCSLPQPFC